MASSNPRRRPSVTTPGDNGQPPKPNKSLRKGATFHSPPSPALSSLDKASSPPQMSRSWSGLEETVGANRRRAALTLDNFHKAMSKVHDDESTPSKLKRQASLRDNGHPVPPGLFTRALAKSDTEQPSLLSRSAPRSGRRGSDSGLGSSLASTADKCTAATIMTRVSAPALTGSSKAKQTLPGLTQRALDRIHEHILRPLMREPDLKEFQQILKEVPRRISSKEIICLRDIEKTLILTAPGCAQTVSSYLDFCSLVVDCIQATVEFLSDREQIRPNDRPYTNGYFIDLKDQILEYGHQLRAARSGKGIADNMDVDPGDKVELLGGIAENGRPAQLVRVKPDGTAISLATGKPVAMDKRPVQFKRSLSEQREDEEEIMRSMARRKKNASPEELAPKRCRELGCNKEFKRPCDLTKHEKTHSRPWKCPFATCKYHEFGWPTEKEMDRHVNDKHSDSPAMYECFYTPCPYKSKRESNCKQHMEKAHGWHYNRSKTNGKRPSSTPASQFQQTPPLGSESTPSTTPAFSAPTPPQEQEALLHGVSILPPGMECLDTHGYQMGASGVVGLGLEGLSTDANGLYPAYQDGPGFISEEDIYAASVQLPSQAPTMNQSFDKMMPGGLPMYSGFQLCQPQLDGPAQPQFQQPQFAAPMAGPTLKQGDAMFYSPPDSIPDEGFDEPHLGVDNGDFALFPAHVDVGNHYQLPLFDEPPSANLGFSQTSQPDIFQQMEWTNLDYANMQQV
ncbi:zinc finger transcription factor ace1 [Hirsutella rhossiliensis]|uniref:Zinc finger transcription factor ace1 n=1 Tax=Hirsutella rhossiliensis TaxID=111463 RepID=A0A9P8SLP7_9HYPO|nr:zinc finger transcription factor ace1 [Hirsutella rhossiliensis]KAH0967171.1 zinc finger transcription factor ace1 [Hirsutella rhossiliensis]